jgi:hypothetical protein
VGGGGPVEGSTRASNGRHVVTLDFEFDPRSVDRVGVAVSRAKITPEQLETLAREHTITLTSQDEPRTQFRFPTKGLLTEWRRLSDVCR